MDKIKELIGRKGEFTNRFAKFQDFHNLMRFRIRRILLVSSFCRSYFFEEDERLYELLGEEYHHLNFENLFGFLRGRRRFNTL